MSLLDAILLLVAFFSVWLPVVIAILARRSPVGVRAVLALSGIASGIYAASIHSRVGHASDHDRGWGMLLIPFTTAALSFYLALTGVCLLTVARLFRLLDFPADDAPIYLHSINRALAVCSLMLITIALVRLVSRRTPLPTHEAPSTSIPNERNA